MIKILKATPMGTGIVTTADVITQEDATRDGIIDESIVGNVSNVQTVITASKYSKERGIEEGQKVILNFNRYAKTKQKLNSIKSTMDEHYENVQTFEIPEIEINGESVLILDVSDVQFIINEFEK